MNLRTVLVVDDDEVIRMFIKHALERKGIKVLESDDGDVAVTMVRRHQDIDLVILDLLMPKMNGLDAYREIRQIRPGLKCIVSTGDIDNEYCAELSSMGVRAFLKKPYYIEDLYRSIASVNGMAEGGKETPPEGRGLMAS